MLTFSIYIFCNKSNKSKMYFIEKKNVFYIDPTGD